MTDEKENNQPTRVGTPVPCKSTEIRVPIFVKSKKGPVDGKYFVTSPVLENININLKEWLVFIYPPEGTSDRGEMVLRPRGESRMEKKKKPNG